MPVTIVCPLYPTEDSEKILKVLNYFHPEIAPHSKRAPHQISVCIEGDERNALFHIRQLIHDNRVIDVFRRIIERNMNVRSTFFHLDKQAAYISKLRLVDILDENPPLGSVRVDIETETEQVMKNLIAWLVPATKDGKVIRN